MPTRYAVVGRSYGRIKTPNNWRVFQFAKETDKTIFAKEEQRGWSNPSWKKDEVLAYFDGPEEAAAFITVAEMETAETARLLKAARDEEQVTRWRANEVDKRHIQALEDYVKARA